MSPPETSAVCEDHRLILFPFVSVFVVIKDLNTPTGVHMADDTITRGDMGGLRSPSFFVSVYKVHLLQRVPSTNTLDYSALKFS